MTKQEIFSKIRSHLLMQNAKALNPHQACVYRSHDGMQCAVGCLIPKEAYSPMIEKRNVRDLIEQFPELHQYGIDSENQALLEALQHIHDHIPITYWPANLAQLALEFGLE